MKKIGIGIALVSGLYFASPNFALAQDKMQIPTYGESSLEEIQENEESFFNEQEKLKLAEEKEIPSDKKEFFKFYSKKVAELSKDSVFDYRDIEKLDKILGIYFEREGNVGYSDLDSDSKENKKYTQKDIKSIIEKKILINYPGLIYGKGIGHIRRLILSYPAYSELSEGENNALTELGYQTEDNRKFKIRDLVLIYDGSGNKFKKINPDMDKETAEKTFFKIQKLYDSYFFAKKQCEENSMLNKRISISIGEIFLGPPFCSSLKTEKIEESLEKFVSKDAEKTRFNVDESSWKIPLYFPGWSLLFSIPFGIVFPFLRSRFLSKYSGRDYDSGDLLENVFSTTFGAGVLDSVHPLAYPARLIVPIFFEPIRKACHLKWKDGRRR